jgi:hypothetical protein
MALSAASANATIRLRTKSLGRPCAVHTLVHGDASALCACTNNTNFQHQPRRRPFHPVKIATNILSHPDRL